MSAEQDAMTRLAAANPVPVAEKPLSTRALFLERAVLARPRGRPRHRWRFALVPAGLVAAAVATFAVVHRPAPPPPAPPVSAFAPPQAILSAAARQSEQAPAPGRFMHVTGAIGRVVHSGAAGGYDVVRVDDVRSVQPADGQPGEGWVTIGDAAPDVRPLTDADADAYRRAGSPEIPRPDDELAPDLAGDIVYEGDVAALPGDPAAARAAMLGWPAEAGLDDPGDPQGWLFREGTRLLDTFTGVLGGADRAKVLRMLAGLSGVRTLQTAADPLGRPALGLSYTARTARYGLIDWQIYLGPDTGRVMFTQAVVREPGPANATLTPGAVQYTTAVTGLTFSDKP